MAQFPRTDPELIALAHDVLTGYRAHPDIFHNPPINLEGVDSKLTDYAQVDHAWNVNQAEGIMLTAKRCGISGGIASDIRALLRHAETVVQDPAQLKLINWGGRAAPTPLQAPVQVQNLTDAKQGADWSASLGMRLPAAASLPLMSSNTASCPTATGPSTTPPPDTKITLAGHPKGKTLEDRVFARNKAWDCD